MAETGFAKGRLSPIIYFENEAGRVVLPPSSDGARAAWERSYKRDGYEIREADTLAAVERLQKRLVAQELEERERQAAHSGALRDAAWRVTGADLAQRMRSSATTPWERDFIEAYLQLREEKRERHRQRFLETSMYLDVLEFDSGHQHRTDRLRV